MKLQGRIAIVTGSGGGFGEGIAKHFAELGANVVVADIRADHAERVAAEIKAAGGDAVGTHVEGLHQAALATAAGIGTVAVEMGGTACKLPGARESLQKVAANAAVGKKRKTAKC